MKFERCDIREVEKVTRNNKLMAMIHEFQESDMDAARITFEANEYKNSTGCAAAINNAIRRSLTKTIKCVTRKGNVYLVKADAMEKIR